MKTIIIFGFVLLISHNINYVYTKNLKKMEYTLNLLKEGDEFITVGTHEDVVLLMGNTGSGKSTLTQFLTGDNNNLISVEVGKETGEFIIEDLLDKISNNSTLVSKTIFPELVYDKKTDTPYYDCPGFSDTRNSSIDISSSYFIHKVLDNAKNIKIVFVVNYSSVKEGIDRADFLTLLRHIVTLFKNIRKFTNSISLIVTKIENIYVKKGDKLTLVSDEKILNNVAQFLYNAKLSLTDMINKSSDKVKAETYRNAVYLLDILLMKNNDEYSKIGLFKRPDQSGPLSEIKSMQDNKIKLQNLIGKISYSGKNENDFGYTISDESQNDITDLVSEISNQIALKINSISSELRKNTEIHEKQYRDINTLKNYFISSNGIFKTTIRELQNLKKPKQFAETITKCLIELSVPYSEKNLETIIRYDNFLEFLKLVSSKNLILQPLEWIKSMEGISKYFDDSANAYTFLVDTYVKLGDWSIQRDTNKFNVDNLKTEISQFERRNTIITGNLLRPFLEEIYYAELKEGYTIRGFDSIKNVEFDILKRSTLFDILDITLNGKNSITCVDSNKIVAKGDYIKLSEVISKPVCQQNVEGIDITAVNKFFVDTDLIHVGPNMRVIMSAPTWEIIDTRKINLIGNSGEHHSQARAADGASPNYGGITGQAGGNGATGRPGLRGLSGGSFFGIGGKFLNGQNLVIASIGGSGSPGQQGGHGVNGENGKDVDWQFLYSRKSGHFLNKKTYHYYQQVGGAGGAGGNGGNGGVGGLGGPASIVTLIEFGESSKIIRQQINGQDGANGLGGNAGVGGTSGNRCTGNTKQRTNAGVINSGTSWQDIQCHKEKSPDGVPGASASNAEGRENRDTEIVITDLTKIVNEFKSILIENLSNRIKNYYIKDFINELNQQPAVKNLYNAISFTRELENLENRFYKLNDKIDFLPLFQSILRRVLEYAQNPNEYEKGVQYRKVLSYVYSGALSKICSFKSDDDNSLIIDIKEYLNYAIGNINRLQKTSNKVLINEINENYKGKIDNKIKEGNYFITSNILPEIDNINDDMRSKIDILINEIISLQINAEQEREQLIKKQREAVKAADKAMQIGILKGIGKVASLFGPYGQAAGAVIEVATSVSKSLSMDDSSDNRKALIPPGVRTLLASTRSVIEELRNDKLEVLQKQIDELSKNPNPKLDALKKSLTDIKANVNIKTGNEKVEQAQNVLENEVESLKSSQKELTEDTKEVIDYIQDITKYSKIADISMDIYRQYKNDKKKIKILGDAIKQKQNEIDGLREYQKQVNEIVTPLLKKMCDDMQDVIDKVGTKSQIGLDVTKWQVQGAIREIKHKITKFTKGFAVQEDLEFSFNKLNDAMDVLINIYDRIQVYNDQKSLADYISDISSVSSTNIQIDDPNLSNAIAKLDLIIKSNIVLTTYKSAINGLKQYVFPFANYYLADFNLPTDISIENNIEDLVTKAVIQIETLKLKLLKSDSIIYRKHDQFLNNGEFNSQKFSIGPFFKWQNEENRNAIYKLLSGKEVVIYADVAKGSRLNAIKFNEIDLQFKSDIPIAEQNVNEILKGFEVNITHMGNSYYRCDNKFYVIPSESQSIRYSFSKNEYGDPVRKNYVYDKLKTDYMLSPYAMWTIQLIHPNYKSFLDLQKYSEQIRIELSGYGQYLSSGSEVCNANLENYYRLDKSIISEI